MLIRKGLIFSTIFFIFFLLTAASVTPEVKRVRKGIFQTVITVPATGMYRITVSSDTGTAITLTDKMAGPIEQSGKAGRTDGKIYRILQQGKYRIQLHTDKNSNQVPSLKVEQTLPVENTTPVQIESNKIYTSQLTDMKHQSWKLVVPELLDVHLEIMGRSLKDVKIWQEGKWLLKTDFIKKVKAPEPGRYMNLFELNYRFSPGTYIITCYGGNKKQWTSNDRTEPLYMRINNNYYGNAATLNNTISPFGQDYFVTGSGSDTFELKFKKRVKGNLKVKNFNYSESRHGYYTRNTKVRKRWGELKYTEKKRKLIAVSGPPGTSYELNFFINRKYAYLKKGRYWISTVPSIKNSAPLPVAATLYNRKTRKYPAFRCIDMKSGSLNIKMNLESPSETLIYVNKSGSYKIHENSSYKGKGLYSFHPQFVKVKREIPWHNSNTQIELVKGYYLLKIRDIRKGILQFSVIPSSAQPDFSLPVVQPYPITWPEVKLDNNSNSYLKITGRKNQNSGLVIRSLPLNLANPLNITLPSGKKVPLKIRLKKRSRLSVSGDIPEISVNGIQITSNNYIAAGYHTLNISNSSNKTRRFILSSIKADSDTVARSNTRTIKDKGHIFYTLNRGETVNTVLNISNPGFYRIETTGRLETEMVVRTVSEPQLYRDKGSGTGRNSMVLKYLKSGDYYITVKSLKKSKGRCGLEVRKIPPHTTELLKKSATNSILIPSYSSAEYRFRIEKEGEYRIVTRTLKAPTQCMLMDSDNWPLIRPGRAADIKLYLSKGDYRYFTLPLQIRSRRLTEIRKITRKKNQLKGKGPHPVRLNHSYRAIWMETEDNIKDKYIVNLPVEMKVTLSLPDSFRSLIITSDKKRISSSGVWTGVLPAGKSVIEVSPVEKDNRRKYTIALSSDTLVPDITLKNLNSGLPVPVAVPSDSMVHLYSSGDSAVEAVLKDSSGKVVATSGYRNNDWNFSIRKQLIKGTYFLNLHSRGKFRTSVSMRAVKFKKLPAINIPSNTKITAKSFPVKIPFRIENKDQVVSFSAGEQTILTITKDGKTIARAEGRILIPLKSGTDYRLSLWQSHKTSTELVTRSIEFKPRRISGSYLTLNNRGTRLTGKTDSTLSLASGSAEVLFSNRVEVPLLKADMTVSTSDGQGWIYSNTRGIKLMRSLLKTGVRKSFRFTDKLILDIEKPVQTVSLLEAGSPNLLISGTASDIKNNNGFPGGVIMNRGTTLIPLPEGRNFTSILRDAHSSPAPVSIQDVNRTRKNIDLILREYRVSRGSLTKDSVLRIPPGKAVVIDTASYSYVRAALSENMLIFSWKNNKPFSIGDYKSKGIYVSSKLYVVNRGDSEGIADLQFSPPPTVPEETELNNKSRSYEQYSNSEKYLRFIINSSSELFIGSPDFDYRIWNSKGLITHEGHGSGIINPGKITGTLEINNKGKALKVWLEDSKSPDSFVHGTTTEMSISRSPLQLNKSAVIIKLDKHINNYLHISSDSIVKIEMKQGNNILRSDYIHRDTPFSYYIKDKNCSVVLQAPSGNAVIETALIKPVRIDETSPPATQLVSRNRPHAYLLSLKNSCTVGAGIKSEENRVTLKLFNNSSELLETSPLIIKKLKGEYLLVVESDENPATYQLIIKGTVEKRKIPKEVILKYIREKRQ